MSDPNAYQSPAAAAGPTGAYGQPDGPVGYVAPMGFGAPGVPNGVGQPRRIGKTRNPWGVWLLTLVTVGFYGLYWYFKVNEEVRDYDQHVKVQPGVALCAILFGGFLCGIPAIVSIVNTGGRISQCQQASGSRARCSGVAGLLLGLIGFHAVYYQSQLNKVWDQHGNPPEGSTV